MQTLASTGQKIKFNSNEKPITLWDIISENQQLFTVIGQKFYSTDNSILSFFHGYKYKINDSIINELDDESIDENDDDIKDWLNFVKECIANDGNDDTDENYQQKKDEIYNYILNWISFIMQNPDYRTGTAIIIKGLQGTGKGTFTNVLSELLSGYSEKNVTELSEITGKNNSVIENKKLIILNEAKNAGEDRMANFDGLKSKITDDEVRIEEKFQPRRTVENVCNYIICTNNSFPVKVETSDRRFLVLTTNPKYMNDFDYWNNLNKTMYEDAGGNKPKFTFFNKLTEYFLNRDISKFNPRKIPETQAKEILTEASRKPIEIWIEEHYNELTSETGMPKSKANSEIPTGMKPKYFSNEISTYCKDWQPRIDGKRTTAHYYKLLPQLVNKFKPKETIPIELNNDNK